VNLEEKHSINTENRSFEDVVKLKYLGTTLTWDRIRNEVIRQQIGVQSMEEIRKRRRMERYCHIKRMEEYRLPKRAREMKVTNCKDLWVDNERGGMMEVQLDMGSRGEEWMNIQKGKTWEDRAK
jgi:hypothetical protein